MKKFSLAQMPLYPDERQIAIAVLGPDRARDWDGIAAVLERRGLPSIDPLTGGRYWPAVKAFFDRRHGVTDVRPLARVDGQENWGRRPPRRRRVLGVSQL